MEKKPSLLTGYPTRLTLLIAALAISSIHLHPEEKPEEHVMSLKKLTAATPLILGGASLEPTAPCAVRHVKDNTFEASWHSPTGERVRSRSRDGGSTWSAPEPADTGAIATSPGEEGITASSASMEGQYLVRSSRRVPGIPPAFPSASLVLSFKDDTGRYDLAYADEPLLMEWQSAAIATSPDEIVVVYTSDASEARAIRIPTPSATATPQENSWATLPPFPQGSGVAGIIAGHHNGVLIGAGGTNFPDAPPWEGGTRVTYDDIFTLTPGEAAWRSVGKLPEPRAYAALATLPDGLFVAGGENPDKMFQEVTLLQWTGESIAFQSLPDLPQPVTQPAAVVSEGKVYLAGGSGSGSPRQSLDQFLSFDPEQPENGWTRLPTWPGPSRTLAVMAAVDGWIYVISGLHLGLDGEGKTRADYLRDAYRYHPDSGWETLPDLPWTATAAPSPAPLSSTTPGFFVMGGVDGDQAGKLPRETLLPNDILLFDVQKMTWRLWPEAWPQSVVTSPAIPWNDGWIIPSGEPRGGVRTPNVWHWQPELK